MFFSSFLSLFNFILFQIFQFHPFDNAEENLFAQCKRINRGKQYNIFRVFSFSISLFLFFCRYDTLYPSAHTHTHEWCHEIDYQYSNKSSEKCQQNYIFSIDSPTTITIITTQQSNELYLSLCVTSYLGRYISSRRISWKFIHFNNSIEARTPTEQKKKWRKQKKAFGCATTTTTREKNSQNKNETKHSVANTTEEWMNPGYY